ncbi:unnamed protein product [Fraxinus pennsylvanica]|uniref:Bifunctional inhibitor/plant lipid transfer protein/seed storage helical domain-containing protein n=1 Tax=Fraxinus pennsylvanica TaxID=56036 RepID=A0AAD2DXP7_9LAMI|nr:unnamed protein product [Fraxinus pennsylvanica]
MKFYKTNTLLTLLLLVFVMAGQVQESNGQMSCGSSYFSTLVQLIPCRASVVPFIHMPPTEACCAAIKALGQPCLCALLNGPAISGVDRNMAMQLPDKSNYEVNCKKQWNKFMNKCVEGY